MKRKWIIVLVIISILTAIVTYFNYERIENYIKNKNWQLANVVATIQKNDITQVEAGKTMIAITKNSIDFYHDKQQKENSIELVTSEIVTSTKNEYTVIADKYSGFVYMMKNNEKVWENKITGTIMNVTVNKNGYVAVTYYQAGHKSTIKILKPNGEELFTTFLASTYAVDVAIADNNKFLAVAEIDTETMRAISKVKIIKIGSDEKKEVSIIYEADNCIILDVEYTSDNELLIHKDNGIVLVDGENNIVNIAKYNYSDVVYATIENSENPILVRKNSIGLFGTECVLEIYERDAKKEYAKKEYELSSTPQGICAHNKIIALNMGNEAIFVRTNGKLVKRYNLDGQAREIKVYDNGNMAAVVFKNKIELINI